LKPESRENQQDHVRAEKEISESEARYQILFEKAPISITLVNPAGIITDCNQACERLLGYKKEEIIGKPFQSLMVLNPRDFPDVVNKFEKFFRGEEVAPYELEVIRKTGERRWVNIVNSVMMKGDKIVGLQVLAMDITERKQAEKLSIESERKFREKSFELQIINEIISCGNTSGDLSSFLQKALEKTLQFGHFLGGGIYLYNEITKHNILATSLSASQDFMKMVQDVDMTKEPYKRAFKSQEAFIINEIDQILPELKRWGIQSILSAPLFAKNRYIGTLNLASKVNLTAASSELAFFTLIGQEIGSIIQKFQAEQLMRASEAKYRSLFEDAPYGIVLLDSEGKITECNSTIEKVFGYKKEQIIGYNFLNLNMFSPLTASLLRERFIKMVVGDNLEPIEAEIVKSNGQTVWVHPSVSIIKLDDKKIFQYILQDITDRKLAEQRLKESEEKYRLITENLNEIIGVFSVKGTLEYINEDAHEHVLGYTKEDLLGTRPFDLIHPDDRDSVVKTFQAAFDKKETNIEARVKRKDGTYIMMDVKAQTFKDGTGQVKLLSISRDISEHKKMELELKESEEKYRTLFEQSPNSIVLNDSKGMVIEINATVEKLFGYQKKDMLGKNFLDLGIFPPEALLLVKQKFLKRIKGEPISYYEIPTIKSNGDIVWIYPQGIPIILGNEPHILYILQDVTERKMAQQKLKESEEKYRSLFEKAPFIITLVNTQGKIIEINSTVEKVFGYKKEDLVGRNFVDLEIFSPETLLNLKQNFQSRLKGELVDQNETPIIKANGDTVWIYPQMALLKLEQENMLLYTIQDITKRKVAEQRLKESEERYRLITENSNDFIMVNTIEPTVEYVNEATYHRFLGYTCKDLQGTNPLDLIHPEDQDLLVKAYPAALDVGGTTNEIRVKRKDGTYLWVEMKAKKFEVGSGQTKFLSISRDISERKVLEETRKNNMKLLEHEVEQKTQELRNETEELHKALESLNIAQDHLVQSEKLASIGLLAAGVAHEINNPLMGMINYAQIIRDELEAKLKIDLNVKPYSFLNGIIKEGERISEIVEGLLSFAREDRGEFVPAEISEIINSALALLLPRIKNSQIDIKLEYDNSIPKVPMKTRNIRQVILNVLQNSIAALNEKYSTVSKKGDKVITIKTSKLILDEKPCVKISIKDNGTGIRSENLAKVFDPFFTTKSTAGIKGEGTGLGLSISYGIIKNHKGRIEIQSEWGSWTLLSIILPLEL